MRKRRIFISAVSGEFRTARIALAADLRRRGIDPVEQEAFPDDIHGETLLIRLRDLIKSCDGLISLQGARCGSFPPRAAAEPFDKLLPAGFAEASRTQWEIFFAQELGVEWRLFRAGEKWEPDEDKPEPARAVDAQARFTAWLTSKDVPWAPFNTPAELCNEAGHIHWKWMSKTGEGAPTNLPYPSIGTLFKGRETFLTTLRASLLHENGGTAAIVSNAIHGMGGIGKTRAAVEYAWAHRDDYTALLFVQADSRESLESGLANLTGTLRLPEAAAREDSVKRDAALAWLCANPGWFLILDNVDSESARDASIAMLGRVSGGHVVLTSRLDRGAWGGVEPLDLDVLSDDAAAALLIDASETTRPKRPDDAAQARALAAELGHLALALNLAAATIRERRCDFAAYRTLWRDAREKVRLWNKQTLTGYHTAVAQTWQTSVALVSAEARTLLERLAFLAPDPIPDFLLDVAVPDAEALDAREARLDLVRYSLVSWETEADRFAVHRLIQDATRRGLPPDAARRRLTEALGWVKAAFTGDVFDVRSWPRLDPLATHAAAVVDAADREGLPAPALWLMAQLGSLFGEKAQHARSEPFRRRAMEIAEAAHGRDHPEVAAHLNNLAQLLKATNRLVEAEPLMRRALSIDEASFGADHPNVARDLNNLALLLKATNRLAEAEPLMRRALSIDEASFGADHPKVAIRLNNLASLLQDTNRLVEAEPLMRRALTIDEASFGADHPNVAIDLNNLALLLKATNRLAEAEPLMRRALSIDEASFGADHPKVAIRLNNLAPLLQATNRLAEAEPLMRRALTIDEASFGADHPEVAIDLVNLASLLLASGRAAEAEAPMRRASIIFLSFTRLTGHVHPHRDAALAWYRHVLTSLGRDDAAIEAAIESAHRAAGLP